MRTAGLIDSRVAFRLPSKQETLLFGEFIAVEWFQEDFLVPYGIADTWSLLEREGVLRRAWLSPLPMEAPRYAEGILWLPGAPPESDVFSRRGETLRHAADRLALTHGVAVTPVIESLEAWTSVGDDGRPVESACGASLADAARVVISGLPVPAPDVPWERIIDFARDPDSRAKASRLRHWMRTFTRQHVTPQEVAQELEYLVNDYREYMRIQRLKTTSGLVKTIVTVAAEAVDSVLRLSAKSLVGAAFKARHQRIALLESEANAPGREVAYLVKVEDTFGGR